ncbi:NUDIX hydrolase [Amycolatopsis sp. WAC 01375]|uniref:NUDIX domain-containing protein n=1 Tax=Amycolatopsis sp. WAC 01375 TaxID=2203194 RepID=UPI000F7998F3|nr:NUDIX hydrolase [Amycolatopsis sp. WAC 01375]RSM75215.1 NUDIX hydrolase [Amycolatopsis sp. WAC 01375]
MTEQAHHLSPEQAAQFFQDMEAEGEPEVEFNPGIASRIASKTVAAGVLINDEQGRIFFVTPIYKPYPEIPGGVVDANESPYAACQREIREELGINIEIGNLLVVDWMPQHGVWRDSLQFIFDGGVLSEEDIRKIRLPPDELKSFGFHHLGEVKEMLKPSFYRRLVQANDAKQLNLVKYTDFGR